MPRRGSALIAIGIVLVLAAALLPGTDLHAFAVPTFTFVVVTFAWRVAAPADLQLPPSPEISAPLDPRGPPCVSFS
ncbi:MAG: hypothetical protein KAY59_08535 [Acidobacteria bacterium]|nr:hypothetical protein [Acidobacteriota bacterium]